MQLKIKVKIDDDRTYRTYYSPYHINKLELLEGIDRALDDAIDIVNESNATEMSLAIMHEGDPVGTLSVTLKELR